jgi:hypothetical protein
MFVPLVMLALYAVVGRVCMEQCCSPAEATQRVEWPVVAGGEGGYRPRGGGDGGGVLPRHSCAAARHSSTTDRPTYACTRCRITALKIKISRERNRLFRNGRTACFEPVIDSVK